MEKTHQVTSPRNCVSVKGKCSEKGRDGKVHKENKGVRH